MKSTLRKIGISVSIAAGVVGMSAGLSAVPAVADGNGATTVPCSDFFSGVQGTIVINQNGMLINCFQHTPGDGGGVEPGTSAQVIDCSQALGFPAKGVQVITPDGAVLTNCHPHFI
jgi:hypothetical protein